MEEDCYLADCYSVGGDVYYGTGDCSVAESANVGYAY